jgi:hypothetical protein
MTAEAAFGVGAGKLVGAGGESAGKVVGAGAGRVGLGLGPIVGSVTVFEHPLTMAATPAPPASHSSRRRLTDSARPLCRAGGSLSMRDTIRSPVDFVGVQIARSPYHLAPVCQRSLKCQVVGDAI